MRYIFKSNYIKKHKFLFNNLIQINKYTANSKLVERTVSKKEILQNKNDQIEASFDYNHYFSVNNLIKKVSIDLNINQTRLNSSTSSLDKSSKKSPDPYQKPCLEQLLLLKEKLSQHLPKFLHESHPYSLYAPDIVFENFYKEPGKITVGALQYAVQLTMLRFKIHWKFSHAKLEVLKITHDEADGTIKIRWRIVGVRGMKSMTQPWKIKAWKVKETVKNEAEWHDGFSILYVRGDGLIYKHTLQRIMSQKDEEPVLATKNKKLKLENLDVGPTICKDTSTS